MITASLVTYNNDLTLLRKLIKSCIACDDLTKLYIINNGRPLQLASSPKIELIELEKNVGFGKAHNVAFRKILNQSDYHLVVNPDIIFDAKIISELKQYMDVYQKIGLMMPKVLNMDGTVQYNCKLLPSPFNLIIRRFLYFFPSLLESNNYQYEMRFTNYDAIQQVPVISGCFMFFRTAALKKIGLFDERYFLYVEDVDICRRINEFYQTIYFPKVSVYHQHAKGSYKSLKLMWYNMVSAIRYFNKWGWWDNSRKKINEQLINNNKAPDAISKTKPYSKLNY